jgi:hypothetical protein
MGIEEEGFEACQEIKRVSGDSKNESRKRKGGRNQVM